MMIISLHFLVEMNAVQFCLENCLDGIYQSWVVGKMNRIAMIVIVKNVIILRKWKNVKKRLLIKR